MKTAQFHNFTNEEFIGWWDGKSKKFAPDARLYMPDYLAQHFAKHLVNRELLSTKPDGSLVYKDGDKMTSPKKPEQVPMFMELFNKAYIPDETEDLGDGVTDNLDALIGSANKNRAKMPDVAENPRAGVQAEQPAAPSAKQDPTKPQIVLPPEGEEEDDESSFENKPQE